MNFSNHLYFLPNSYGNKKFSKKRFNSEEQKDNILPASARRWNIPLKDIEGFGRYNVTATFTYGASNKTIEVSQVFWVVPLPMIIGAVVALLLIIGVTTLACLASDRWLVRGTWIGALLNGRRSPP